MDATEVENKGNEGSIRGTGTVTAEVKVTPGSLITSTITSIIAFLKYELGARTSNSPLRNHGERSWRVYHKAVNNNTRLLTVGGKFRLLTYMLLALWVWRYVRSMFGRRRPVSPNRQLCHALTRLPRNGLGVLLALGF